MDFLELLSTRKSIRNFNPTPIEKETIHLLLEAALKAPSGKQKNHWDFICIENKAMLSSLAKCKPHSASLIDRSPLSIVVIGDPTISDTWIEDCSIASIIIQLEATNLGIGSCWVQIEKRNYSESMTSDQYVKALLNIPDHKSVLSIIALGYPTDEPKSIHPKKTDSTKVHYEKY